MQPTVQENADNPTVKKIIKILADDNVSLNRAATILFVVGELINRHGRMLTRSLLSMNTVPEEIAVPAKKPE